MDANEATKHLATIRRIMESATQLTTLPGKAAIGGGIIALAASGVTYAVVNSLDIADIEDLPSGPRAGVVAMWIGVAVLGILLDVILTVRTARRRGANPWSRLAQLAAYAMGPAILAACLLTVKLVQLGEWQLLPAIWMLLYGVGVWTAGVLSVRAPKALGVVFMLSGILTLFVAAPISLVMIALTFGVAHIAFGVYLTRRFGD